MSIMESDLVLELHRLDELPPALRARSQARLAAPDAPAALEALRQSDADILAQLPAKLVAERLRRLNVEHELAKPAHRTSLWTGTGIAIALACLALMVVVKRPAPSGVPLSSPRAEHSSVFQVPVPAPSTLGTASKSQPTSSGPLAESVPEVVALAEVPNDGTRLKGDVARLRVHRIEGSKAAVALRDGDTASPGTLLQATLLPGAPVYAALLSLDGTGQATRHLPEQGDSSLLVQAQVQVPHSFLLDDAPGFERFLLITSAQPFALREAEALLRRSGGWNAPHHPGWSFQSLRISKPEARL